LLSGFGIAGAVLSILAPEPLIGSGKASHRPGYHLEMNIN